MWFIVLISLTLPFFGIFPSGEKMNTETGKQKLIVLLGASVGMAWDIPQLPYRISNFDYIFEYIPHGGFDKSETLNEIISREEKRPDVVIIKECAAYFPGDMDHYKDLMKKWIHSCLESDVIPIPATVVPVTRLHPYKKIPIDIIKGRNPFKRDNPFKSRKNKTILEYNDWIKMYSEQNGLSVLDLEAAMRYSDKNRFLREDLARIDGLHINSKAYNILDQIVIPSLNTIDQEKEKVPFSF